METDKGAVKAATGGLTPLEEPCYLCDAVVKRHDEVVRHHGLILHRRCYEEDIRRGRW